ncbi:F0F1 ATP synthase subunit delta [Herbiconiux sp. L3-i23]|uniref:F0F1 ATP synthase subunit delta n=1 Tax=Herbiconiux sp. L3-i23 TaxID=2905871 RepID=UPI00206B74E5|nr:F0F1 ATP synthase subunit delta [Herbiconiux sp. L3-i23]BDI22009.1 hypothetical protein L3i23_07850 [Herbiconiux sp. L3-i23]
MGSASRQALASSVSALADARLDLTGGVQLLAAARTVGGSAQLRGLLADPGIEAAAKRGLVSKLFVGFGAPVQGVVASASAERWSSGDEFADGLEELGFRAIAAGGPSGSALGHELFTFEQAVRSNAELELALSSKLGGGEAKVALVDRILAGAGEATRAIVRHLVQFPRELRFVEALRRAARIVADASGLGIATVATASPLSDAQLARLEKALGDRYGRALSLNQVIDPSLIGGVRISVGDDVIDGSVAARLNDLRLQLAG